MDLIPLLGWEWGGPGRDGVHQDLFGAMFSEFHETLELIDESFDFPELKKCLWI